MTGASITWVFFDIDRTLCDIDRAVRFGLEAANDVLAARVADRSALPTAAEYQDAWLLSADAELARGVDHEDIRRVSMVRLLRDRGIVLSAAQEDEALDAYFQARFGIEHLFGEVLDALRAIKRGYRLGVVSNGNSYADRIGLDGVFDAEFYAQRVGFRKPDPRIFGHVAETLGLRPAECLMVGDSMQDDVLAARAAGWRAILLDRAGSSGDAADAVRDIAQLAAHLRLGALGELDSPEMR